MNKKAIMYEFLVRLVIATVMVVSAMWIASIFFSIADEARDSFYSLGDSIEIMADGEFKSRPIILDDDTAIIGFSKNAITFQYTHEPLYSVYVERPSSCRENNACLCLCTDGLELHISSSGNFISCDVYSCRTIENADFPSKYQPGFESDIDLSGDSFHEGTLLMRSKMSTPYIDNNKDSSKRRRTIYLEKDEGIVKIYETNKKT